MGLRPHGLSARDLGLRQPKSAAHDLYLEDCMHTLAAIFDIGVHVYACDGQDIADAFVVSGLAREFERPNPTYVSGKSGLELVEGLLPYIGVQREPVRECSRFTPTPDYWVGWVLAYFQAACGLPYRRVFASIPYRDLVAMYHPLHEAPEEKFVDALLDRLYPHLRSHGAAGSDENDEAWAQPPTPLKLMRERAGITQAELAERTGCGVRSIQMYEQRNRDIGRARAADVIRIAQALDCEVEELIET